MDDATPCPVALHWSGGKDSALALQVLQDDDAYDVVSLVTMVASSTGRSAVHDIPLPLLHEQARAVGLPLETIPVADDLGDHDAAMRRHAATLAARGVGHVAFGDLAASGAMTYRRRSFAPLGIEVLAPLYDLTSEAVVAAVVDSGIRAICVVADAGVLPVDVLGRAVDADLLADLPTGVDPAGELGEYHTFVHDAPWFRSPIRLVTGAPAVVTRTVGTTDGPRTYRWWTLPLSGQRTVGVP